MKPEPSILAVNPGSTSTKLAAGDCAGNILSAVTLRHSAADLAPFTRIADQFSYRLKLALEWSHGHVTRCAAVAGMGGLLRPLDGGVYRVNEKMLGDAGLGLQGEHASNLGCSLAASIAQEFDCPAYVVDPVSVDEFERLAYYSGHPLIRRKSLSHALNIHAAARKAAGELGLGDGPSSFVIGHLGGGISIAPVKNGKIIDVNDAASDGPFSPERSGGLPLQEVVTLAFSGKYPERVVRSMIMGNGGCVAYLGTNSVEEITGRIARGDRDAAEVFDAMAYQVAKEIGAMATVLSGLVDAIVLTGGIASSQAFTARVTERVKFIAPVIVYPGEDEMRSLALGAARVLQGIEQAKEY
jgi:butyrate kinase